MAVVKRDDIGCVIIAVGIISVLSFLIPDVFLNLLTWIGVKWWEIILGVVILWCLFIVAPIWIYFKYDDYLEKKREKNGVHINKEIEKFENRKGKRGN